MDQLGDAGHFQFFHDISAMGFHRTQADKQEVGNGLAGVPFGNHLEDLPLPVGEQVKPFLLGGAFAQGKVTVHQDLGDGGAQGGFPLHGRLNGLDYILAAGFL